MKLRIFTVLLVLGLCVGTASAQFSFGGTVYDPTNNANPVGWQYSLACRWPTTGIPPEWSTRKQATCLINAETETSFNVRLPYQALSSR